MHPTAPRRAGGVTNTASSSRDSGAASRTIVRDAKSRVKLWKYAWFHRRRRKRDFRSLWITRISAAVRLHGMTYSQFIHAMTQAKVELNRKSLAEIAVRDPKGFAQIVAAVEEVAGFVFIRRGDNYVAPAFSLSCTPRQPRLQTRERRQTICACTRSPHGQTVGCAALAFARLCSPSDLWGCVAYWPQLDNGFTNWDDNWLITENRWIRSLDLNHVTTIFNPMAPQEIREEGQRIPAAARPQLLGQLCARWLQSARLPGHEPAAADL